MKTMIKLILATLLCVADLSAGNRITKPSKDLTHFTVEGNFLTQKRVQYTVYKMNVQTGVFESELRIHARKHFHVVCDVGTKYIIRFQDKKENVKFLMLDVTRSGYLTVDVDFSKPYDAVIRYTKNGYSLTPFDNLDRSGLLVRK